MRPDGGASDGPARTARRLGERSAPCGSDCLRLRQGGHRAGEPIPARRVGFLARRSRCVRSLRGSPGARF